MTTTPHDDEGRGSESLDPQESTPTPCPGFTHSPPDPEGRGASIPTTPPEKTPTPPSSPPVTPTPPVGVPSGLGKMWADAMLWGGATEWAEVIRRLEALQDQYARHPQVVAKGEELLAEAWSIYGPLAELRLELDGVLLPGGACHSTDRGGE